MNRRQRICPVCGHLEDENADCCTECGAKTIEYEEGSSGKAAGQGAAAAQPKASPGESNAGPQPKKENGMKVILPLVLVLAVAVIAFLPKGDSGVKEDPANSSPESSAATPTSTPDPCEASGHDWKEANYQEPQTCRVCGETTGSPLTPAFELHGLRPNMEEGVTYDYVTACNNDPAFKTVGRLTVSGYRTFLSDDLHEAMDGYEWHTLHVSITFDDENAYDYGIRLGFGWNDYYDIEGMDDSAYGDSDGATICTANYYGTDYTECAFSWEGQGFGEWSEGEYHAVQYENDVYARLPIGYDGWVVTFHDSSIPWDDGMYIYDVADENTLFFRME